MLEVDLGSMKPKLLEIDFKFNQIIVKFMS
jgi:hypothetical protein